MSVVFITFFHFSFVFQVSSGSHIEMFDQSQHNYSAPLHVEQVVIDAQSAVQSGLVVASSQNIVHMAHHDACNDDSDTDVNDKVMSIPMLNYHDTKQEPGSEDYIPDRLNLSISHHDFTGSVPIIHNTGRLGIPGVGDTSLTVSTSDNGLIIEEAVEQEICTSSLEDDEIVRSKPLTAMYLQRKDVGSINVNSIPSYRERKISTPSKSPCSSKFTLQPSSKSLGMEYDDIRIFQVDDLTKMRPNYNDPISVYHPNTGEIHFKVNSDCESEKKSPSSKRSLEAILAASETIKNQDIASEVEIGTYEVEVSPTGKRGRKKKEKKWGIDDDIEEIRKAAKTVAYTLKGMNKKKDGRKRKKPRIRLTLTKSKNHQIANTCLSEEEETEYPSSSASTSAAKGRRGRKRKDSQQDGPNIIYQCEYCDKQFKSRYKVRAHTKIHTEERAFGCDICGASYRRREHLIRHYRNHTNDRPYVCLECGKSYMRAEHLKRHSYDHTGEKPFECPVCPKAFTRHDRLIKHSLVHDK